MNKKAKFLFFCTIFVVANVSGQKITTYTDPKCNLLVANNQLDTPHFCNISIVKSGDKYFIGFPKKLAPISPKVPISAVQPIIANNFYTQNFGFFCKKELQLEKLTKVPFKFRLGSVQQCDWMEGKPNTGVKL